MGKTKAVPAIRHQSHGDAQTVHFIATSHNGLSVTTADGRPVQLAVLDCSGGVIAAGQEVAAAAYEASVKSYRSFLMGSGHLRVLAKPG